MQQVKIWFELTIDKDGYPPFSTESVWARTISVGRYQIDNIPFYARSAAFGDVVSADNVDGCLWFRMIETASSNSLVRVFMKSGRDALLDALEKFDVRFEIASERLMALSVPQKTLRPVRTILRELHAQKILDFEEPIIRTNSGAAPRKPRT